MNGKAEPVSQGFLRLYHPEIQIQGYRSVAYFLQRLIVGERERKEYVFTVFLVCGRLQVEIDYPRPFTQVVEIPDELLRLLAVALNLAVHCRLGDGVMGSAKGAQGNAEPLRDLLHSLAQRHLLFAVEDLSKLEQVHTVESFLVLLLPLQIQRALDALASPGPATEAHADLAVEHERPHPQGPDVPPPLLLLIDLVREPPLVFPGQAVEEIVGADLKPETLPQEFFGFGPTISDAV